MKTSSNGLLVNNAGKGHYADPSAVKNVIKYVLRKGKKPDKDLLAYGGVGVIEFLGTESIIRQFRAVQKMHTRKGPFGRYIDHECFDFPPEAEHLIYSNSLDVDAIAREIAYDFYEKDHCQVIYGVHRPSGNDAHTHIHFAINTVNYMTGNKRRENTRQTREREARFQKIVADAISREN